VLARRVSRHGAGGASHLSRLLADSADAFRAAGHGGAYDGWGEALAFILAGDAKASREAAGT
ncbi:MAG TPA: hypothetical protein VME40_10600, partial [Caulobacteraceae bacterium]|nr:hypothetical protein [Caulobacteraceae bacterium]